MLFSEIKKVLRLPLLLGILFLLIFRIVTFTFMEQFEDAAEDNYLDYIEQLGGVLTPEKESFIYEEQKKISDILEQQEQMESDYLNDRITSKAYEEYNDRLFYAEGHEDAINHIYTDYEYIKSFEQTGFRPEFINYLHWDVFFVPDSVDLVLIFCLTFFSCYFFSMERTSNMWKVIHAAYCGKTSIIHTKILACILVTGTIAGIFYLADFIYYLIGLELNQFSADIQSIRVFSDFPIPLSIGQGVFFLGLWRAAAAALISAVLFLISYLIHKDRLNFLVCFALLIFPVFIKEQLETIYHVSFYPLLNGVSAMTHSSGNGTDQMISIFSGWLPAIMIFIFAYGLVRFRVLRKKG